MKYPKLYSKGKIGNLTLKNRIVMPAMGTGFAASSGDFSDELIRYYVERAKGGVGLIITEICAVEELTGVGQPCNLRATDMKYISSMTRAADAVHAYDTKIFLQLQHPGNQQTPLLTHGNQIVSASNVANKGSKIEPRPLTTKEVEDLVAAHVKAAVIAKTAGFDGVEIHCAHGYLLNQFLSPYTNKRTDKYGGDFFNRMRMMTEIVVGIRYAAPGFPISVRINGSDFTPYGMDEEECRKIARYVESIGASCINVSCGTYESGATIIEPNSYTPGWRKHLAQNIKKDVKIPVIATNTIKTPAFAESLLEEEVSDFVAVGRGNLCDPEWANKGKNDDEAHIRQCLGCMHCFKMCAAGRAIECAVNPILGREAHWGEDKMVKNGDGKVVAVIGGGPAGMQAAIVLAKRGFKPVIFEKGDKLGGQMNYAAIPPHKEQITALIKTMTLELEDLGVEVKLNTEGTVEACKAIGACGVMVAVGGKISKPPIPGIEKAYTYEEVLDGRVELKDKKVAVIGGGLTGLETAEYLSQNNKVSVIEMLGAVGTTNYHSVTTAITTAIKENGGEIRTNTALKAIGEGKEVLFTVMPSAFEKKEEFDAVVLAMGTQSRADFADAYEAEFDKVSVIGEAIETGNIADATHTGYNKAFVF